MVRREAIKLLIEAVQENLSLLKRGLDREGLKLIKDDLEELLKVSFILLERVKEYLERQS